MMQTGRKRERKEKPEVHLVPSPSERRAVNDGGQSDVTERTGRHRLGGPHPSNGTRLSPLLPAGQEQEWEASSLVPQHAHNPNLIPKGHTGTQRQDVLQQRAAGTCRVSRS